MLTVIISPIPIIPASVDENLMETMGRLGMLGRTCGCPAGE